MRTADDLLARELAFLTRRRGVDGAPLTILETGSIRSADPTYQVDDGWSTLTFAGYVRDHGGACYSIDLDTSVAAQVLGREGLRDRVQLIQGHSIDVLAGMVAAGFPPVDFAYLDSDNNPDLILHEYLLVSRLIRSPGLVLVDDVDPGSATVVKGHALVPWLEGKGIPYRIEGRVGTSVSTGVLVVAS